MISVGGELFGRRNLRFLLSNLVALNKITRESILDIEMNTITTGLDL
jgi:hypothetical protein